MLFSGSNLLLIILANLTILPLLNEPTLIKNQSLSKLLIYISRTQTPCKTFLMKAKKIQNDFY